MRRFFPFRTSTSNAGNGKPAATNDARNDSKIDNDGTNSPSQSPGTRSFRSSGRHGASKSEEPSHPQLRRCLSFTSSAIDCALAERIMSCSHDMPWSTSNDSDAPGHDGKAECYPWSSEIHNSGRECKIKVPKSHEFQETDSPCSRCYSCSTGHSPDSSPVALKCRPARLTNLLNRNEVLDLCIDGEEDSRLNEKHQPKLPIRSTAPYVGRGRPPRPHDTVPSSPKSCKEIMEYLGIDDVWHSQLVEARANGTCKVASVCFEGGNNAGLFEETSHFEECKSQSLATVEDICEDLQDVQPPCFHNTSVDAFPSTASRYFAADACYHDRFHGIHDNNLEQDTNEKLLQRAKEVDACLMVPPAENDELNAFRDNTFNSTEMLQLIQGLTEDRKQLASELSSQIKARLTERFAAKEHYRRSKLESDTRIRKLEKEKTEMQSTLERELDRRSKDWSANWGNFNLKSKG